MILYIALIVAFFSCFLILTQQQSLIYKSILLQFALITIALLQLINAYVNSDLSLQNVMLNSHPLTPVLYKISGVWGNHEGSMLLWLWLLSLVSAIFMWLSKFPSKYTAKILCMQSLLHFLFLTFIIFTSNPFAEIQEILPEGKGFNPLLQDWVLAIHPPILYAGYTGFSIAFSTALVSCFYNKQLNLYRWILVPWAFLTLGIGLGGWWAYRELGWGGFWFWDPVENVSLVVWLIATSLLHTSKTSMNVKLPLGIITFLSSIFGIFLVRSGILTSVHSFAFDLSRGIFLFIIFLLLFSTSSALLFYKRKQYQFQPKSLSRKEKTVLLSVFFLLLIAGIIIAAILYPIFFKFIFHKSISIGERFYQQSLSLIFIPVIIFAAVYSSDYNLKNIFKKAMLSIIIVIALHLYRPISSLLPLLYLFSAIMLLTSLIYKKSHLMMTMGHFSLALLVISSALHYAWEFEDNILIAKGETVKIKQYEITLQEIIYDQKDNYLFRQAVFGIEKNKKMIGNIKPQIRFYPIEKTFTTESGILHTIAGDIYMTIGEADQKDKIVAKFQLKPFTYLIWLSIIIMASTPLVLLFETNYLTWVSD